jgi:hypothetical protein
VWLKCNSACHQRRVRGEKRRKRKRRRRKRKKKGKKEKRPILIKLC